VKNESNFGKQPTDFGGEFSSKLGVLLSGKCTYAELENLGHYRLYFENEVQIGDILMDVDGYWKWFSPDDSAGGYWEPYVLRDIADMVDSMNKEWDEYIANDPNIGYREHDLEQGEPI